MSRTSINKSNVLLMCDTKKSQIAKIRIRNFRIEDILSKYFKNTKIIS